MIKTWTGTHPEEVTSKAEKDMQGCRIEYLSTCKHDREFILTIVYSEPEAKPEKKPMRCG